LFSRKLTSISRGDRVLNLAPSAFFANRNLVFFDFSLSTAPPLTFVSGLCAFASSSQSLEATGFLIYHPFFALQIEILVFFDFLSIHTLDHLPGFEDVLFNLAGFLFFANRIPGFFQLFTEPSTPAHPSSAVTDY